HESEDLKNGSVIKGPYHPAFGEIAEGYIWRRKIEKMIAEGNFNGEIPCEKSEVSKIIGHKKVNKKYFYDKYKIEIKPIPSEVE
ncbi:MAG: hypothetical protein IKC07_01100, partial [Clostridia bacterium]|nr:hypothetical protein [Clostridia bacterium]